MPEYCTALRIDTLEVSEAGAIGMCCCPGRRGEDLAGNVWQRDLQRDIESIRCWGAMAVVSLVTLEELKHLGAESLCQQLSIQGITWHHCPIVDRQAPDSAFEKIWSALEQRLLDDLAQGRRILLHCAAGLGRTGTIAAKLLVAIGVPAQQAIERVRAARPGTIESAAQLNYLCRLPNA